MKRDFETILDESLSYLKQGKSIEACLQRHPQFAAQLEPLLRVALMVEDLEEIEPPSAEARAAGRERLLQEATRLRRAKIQIRKPARGKCLLPCAAAAFIITLLLTLALLLTFVILVRLDILGVFQRPTRQWETPGPWPTTTLPAVITPRLTTMPPGYQAPVTTPAPQPGMTPTSIDALETTDTAPVPTCTPTATPTSEPTDTPVPTMTPAPPTDTPVPTETPEPTDTPVPTATLVPPTDTPVPTPTPVPPTDTPVLTVTPTDTPVPTATSEPTDTPEPDDDDDDDDDDSDDDDDDDNG